MTRSLLYCTACGGYVGPYQRYVPPDDAGGEPRTYWCPHCVARRPAPNVSRTSRLCESCGQAVPLGLRYCGYCGAAADSAAAGATAHAPADVPVDARQALLRRIAQILSLVANPPGRRDRRQPGDREGPYQFWFDGGAGAEITGGATQYSFADGALAWDGVALGSGVDIRLVDGCRVHIAIDSPRRDPLAG